MADRIQTLLELQRGYIFNSLMGAIDIDKEEDRAVLKLNNLSVSLRTSDEFDEDADTLARGNLLRSQKNLLQIRKRYEHALRRLRQKGYCVEKSLPDLLGNMFQDDSDISLASTTWNCLVKTLDSRGMKIEITDDMWFRAMDKLFLLTNRRLLSDKEASFVPYCEDHLLELYILLDDCIAQHIAQLTCEEAVQTLRRGEGLITRSDAKKMARHAVESFASTVSDDLAKATRDLDTAAAEKARLSEAADKLLREKRQLEKECYALRKENGSLTEELALARSTPHMGDPIPASDALFSDDFDLDSEYIDLPDTEELPELTKTGVLFVGGHPNFTKKLKELYPNWAYISSENAPAKMKQYGKLEMCFIYTGHISHPVYWGVMNAAKSNGAPYSYVKAQISTELLPRCGRTTPPL